MASKPMKRCSMSLIIREIQTKTAMRYYLTLAGCLLKKQNKRTSVGEDVEKLEHLYTVGEEKNSVSTVESCKTVLKN